MLQLFHPAMNAVGRILFWGGPAMALFVGVALGYAGGYSDWVTYKNVAREQPVPFSHEHHVGGLGLDCRYCHVDVEVSAFAGMPATKVCMTCHSEMWIHAPMLAPVRESWAMNVPLQWTRVYDLPDYVYFDHSIHIAKGVGCSTCHGNINEMPLTRRAVNLQMRWCIECHEAPQKYLRPAGEIFAMPWKAPADQLEVGAALADSYHIQTQQMLNCSLCHR